MPTNVLDLNSPDGTFVRTFVESTTLAFFAGGAGQAYPGFAAAMQPAIDPARHDGTALEAHGVSYFRLTEFTHHSEDQARVTGCVASPFGHPSTPIESPGADSNGIVTAFLLTYERRGQSPPPNQHGGQRAPSTSVFGDWHALEYDPLHAKAGGRPAIDPCIGRELDDPTTPSPGWPKNTPAV